MISYAPLYLLLVGLVAAFAVYLVVRRGLSGPACILLFVTVFAVEWGFESSHVNAGRHEARLQATHQLNYLGQRLGGLLRSHLAATEGLAAYVASHPELTEAEFENFAAKIMKRQEYLINLAVAPDLVVTMVHPLEGNEAALGLNYLEMPSQMSAVLKARDQAKPVLAGPVDLVQGGVGLIGRLPVFVTDRQGNRTFWGIVSATIDAHRLFAASGLFEYRDGMQVALRGVDGKGKTGEIIFGSPDLFAEKSMLDLEIPVASGRWVLSGYYPEHAGLAFGVWFLRIVALLVVLVWLFGLEQNHRVRTNERYYRKQLRAGQQLMQEAGKMAGVAGWKIDKSGKEVRFSDEFSKMVGLSHLEFAASEQLLARLSQEAREQVDKAVRLSFSHGDSFDIEVSFERSDGERWLRILGNPVHENGEVVEVVGAIQDVTERKHFIQTIERQATTDSLTELPNRNQFDVFLEHEIARSRRRKQRLAVLFIDLDEFKSVNDNLGHNGGDELLIEASKRILACIRESDTVARLSGDEFAVILPDIESANAASVVAAKIVAAMNQPFELCDRKIFISASLGIAVYPDDGKTTDELLINADQAMYEVKKSVRNDFTFFTQELQQRSEERHDLFNKLSLAVSEQRLELHYQPIIPLDGTGRIACEALVRWREDGKYIPPDAFIPLAEETGLITEIDRFVLQEATAFMESLAANGVEPPGLSVNVSPRIFFDRAGELARWIEHVKLCAQRTDLTIEITERLLTQDTPHAMVVLQQLRADGVKIAIDDFGTGYSSLSYLAKFPVDTLKVDAFFVSKIPHDASAVTLTESILSLGRELSLRLVAEGVETAEQLHFLEERGCHSAQGFWMSRPQPAHDFSRWLSLYRDALAGCETSAAQPAIARLIAPLQR
jgi:diguanylate cyclase (GGDEF)-like protein/PAS domain S-box-containing protein